MKYVCFTFDGLQDASIRKIECAQTSEQGQGLLWTFSCLLFIQDLERS